MMRKIAVALGVSAFLFAGTASANFTIDLIWADTGTPTLTVTPGDGTAVSGADACHNGFLSGAGVGRCLLVRLTAAKPWTAAITTVGWNNAASGLTVDFAANNAFGKFGAGPAGISPVGPQVAGIGDCSPACDNAYGSFGGLGAASTAGGTFLLGSINFDTSGALAGIHSILNFARTGVDGVTDKNFVPAAVQLNGAVLNVVPEPGTATLLGLGIMGIALAGRRRKA